MFTTCKFEAEVVIQYLHHGLKIVVATANITFLRKAFIDSVTRLRFHMLFNFRVTCHIAQQTNVSFPRGRSFTMAFFTDRLTVK